MGNDTDSDTDRQEHTHWDVSGWWRSLRNRRFFDAAGEGCQLDGRCWEVKGHVTLGSHCVLRNNLVFRTHKEGRILIGDGVELADYVLLMANQLVEVGANSYIGPHCVLRDTNHSFRGSDLHWRLLPHQTDPIRIGSNCYLGARSYIMPGVTVGDGAVVGPASIVTKSVGPCEVWAGSPVARMVAHRTDPSKRSMRKRDLGLISMFGFEAADAEEEADPPCKLRDDKAPNGQQDHRSE